MNPKPIINCHTHIFTGDSVPPFLAKTFVPPPLHFLIPVNFIVAFFRWWYKYPATIPYLPIYKKVLKILTAADDILNKIWILKVIAGYYIFLLDLFLLYGLIVPFVAADCGSKILTSLFELFSLILPVIESPGIRLAILFITLLLFKTVRNFIIFAAKMIWTGLTKLPGENTKEILNRYLNIGRYAFHRKQQTILSKLKSQYPPRTKFVVLPMDMDYMSAGKSKTRYRDQMEALASVKEMPSNSKILYPFVFADPRRMVPVEEELRYKKGDKEYFSWTIENGKMVLEDCFIREYLETRKFSGIKIYPALGYYPFDEKLLPLWKYAVENQIPVMTHCIKGVIFYRGIKKSEWSQHPIFEELIKGKRENQNEDGFDDAEILEQQAGEAQYRPLLLSQFSNLDFSYNFTHPMNFLCLLDEKMLRRVIANAVEKDPQSKLIQLFGFTNIETPLTDNLEKLKICLGHFGGEDEWKRYFEKDRYNFSSQLIKYPDVGIRFFETSLNKPSKGKSEQIWKYTDWYSIICSMMLQYSNVYADISYILHGNLEIQPLLKQTLQNPGLRTKVLYGTDFFVVRNHKSDKNMLADMMGGLSEKDFDQIARDNPEVFLSNKIS